MSPHVMPLWPALRISALLAAGCLTGLIGCGKGRQPATDPTQPSPTAALTGPFAQGDSQEGVVAMFDLTIDASRTSVEATPRVMRTGQKQGDIFDLDIADFQNRRSFRIIGLGRRDDGMLEITFRHAHPFAAPDFQAPTSGTNRSDLGYTGRVLVLADLYSEEFFDGTVRLDPYTVEDADGYLNAAGLLEAEGLSNTAFPYMLLADEAKDNRVGVSNGGEMGGNYDPPNAGWHRGTVSDVDGWTGFDYVFQGQEIENKIVIDPAALPSGDLTLQAALLVRYTDPRGGVTVDEKRANRMVPATPDFTKFAMRLPHAAMETSVCSVDPDDLADYVLNNDDFFYYIRVLDQPNSCAPIFFTLRDWDSLATESTDDDLSDEPNVDYVVPGAAALPGFEVDAPDLGSRTNGAILHSYDEGLPGSELKFQAILSNESGTAAPGNYLACMKITDAESGSDSGYHYGIDPATFSPTEAPIREVYYPISYEVMSVPAAVSAAPVMLAGPCETQGVIGETGVFTALASNNPVNYKWNFGGGFSPNIANGNPLIGTFATAVGIYVGSVTALNAYGNSDPYYFVYNVGLPEPSDIGPIDTIVVRAAEPGSIAAGNAAVLQVTERGVPPIGTASVQFDWNQDGDYDDLDEGPKDITGEPPHTFASPIIYPNLGTTSITETIGYSYSYSAYGISRQGAVSFTVKRATMGSNLTLGEATGQFGWGGGHSQPVTAMVFDPNLSRLYVAAQFNGSLTTDPIMTGISSGVLIAYDLSYSAQALNDPPVFPIIEYAWHDYLYEAGPGGDLSEICDIALDPIGGGPVIVGRADAQSDFAGTDMPTSGVFLAKYTPSGTLSFLTALEATSGVSALDDLVIGSDGKIYTSGLLAAGTVNASISLLSGTNDAFMVNFTSGGIVTWAGVLYGTVGASAQIYVSDIALDEINDRVFYGGHTYLPGNYDLDPGAGVVSYANLGFDDGFLLALGTDGVYDYSYYYATGLYERVTAVAVDPSNGDIRIGMNNSGADVDPGGGVQTMGFGGVVALSAAGTFQWMAPMNAWPDHMVIDPDDQSVRSAGTYAGTADFDPGAGTISFAASNQDAFYSRLSRHGNYQAHAVWGGTGVDRGNALVLTGGKHLLFAGTFDSASMCFGNNRTSPCVSRKCNGGYNDFWLMNLSEDGRYATP